MSLEIEVLKEKEKSLILEKKQENRIKKFLKNSYFQFIVKRIIFYFIVFFVALSLTFLLPRLIAGDPIKAMIDQIRGDPDRERIYRDTLKLFNLDLPLWEQYIVFLREFFTRGNLGISIQYARPVIDLVLVDLPNTLILVIPTLIITFLIKNFLISILFENQIILLVLSSIIAIGMFIGLLIIFKELKKEDLSFFIGILKLKSYTESVKEEFKS